MKLERALRIIERECRLNQGAAFSLRAHVSCCVRAEARGASRQCEEVRKLCRRIRAQSRKEAPHE